MLRLQFVTLIIHDEKNFGKKTKKKQKREERLLVLHLIIVQNN